MRTRLPVNFYGWSRDELCTMGVPDINTLSKEEILEEMRSAAENKKNYFEFRHRLKDGSLRDVAVFSSAVQLPDRTILNSVIIDITEQKEVETRLMHALRQKGLASAGGSPQGKKQPRTDRQSD